MTVRCKVKESDFRGVLVKIAMAKTQKNMTKNTARQRQCRLGLQINDTALRPFYKWFKQVLKAPLRSNFSETTQKTIRLVTKQF